MISPVTILTKRGKGRPGYSWCVTKSETKQKAKLQKYFFETFVVRRLLLEQLGWLPPLEWLIFAPKRNVTYMSGTPFLTLLSFLPQRLNLSTGF